MSTAIEYTQTQLDFIQSNCVLNRKELAEKVNTQFGTTFTVDQIRGLCKRKKWNTGRTGCFEKGSKPWNTGTKGVCKPNSGNFKKGQITWNKKPIGYERIDNKDGYVHIKIAEPNVFALKHRYVWEQHHGPVPDNHVVAFKNQDKTDCRLENLILMKRGEMAVFNRWYGYISEPGNNLSCLLIAKLKHKKLELKRAV